MSDKEGNKVEEACFQFRKENTLTNILEMIQGEKRT